MPDEQSVSISATPTTIQTAPTVAVPATKIQSPGDFIPVTYRDQEIKKGKDGKVELIQDKDTGLVYKTLILSNPVVPAGKKVKPGYDRQIHILGMRNGVRESLEIYESNGKTLIEKVNCKQVDL